MVTDTDLFFVACRISQVDPYAGLGTLRSVRDCSSGARVCGYAGIAERDVEEAAVEEARNGANEVEKTETTTSVE